MRIEFTEETLRHIPMGYYQKHLDLAETAILKLFIITDIAFPAIVVSVLLATILL